MVNQQSTLAHKAGEEGQRRQKEKKERRKKVASWAGESGRLKGMKLVVLKSRTCGRGRVAGRSQPMNAIGDVGVAASGVCELCRVQHISWGRIVRA